MKKVIILIEFIFSLIIGLFTVASLGTFFGANYSSDFVLSVFLVVVLENVIAPIFILFFIWRAIRLQLSIDKSNYLILVLVTVSSLLLFNSWGLHSFEFWSSISCAASVITAIIGFIQIKTLRKSTALTG
jgi:membrane-associated HD superfamily phosphohydrolase